MGTLRFAEIPEGRAPLFLKYQGEFREQPGYLDLDENGNVEVGTNPEIGRAIPVSVWNRRTVRWTIPGTAKGVSLSVLLEQLKPLLERVHAGHSVDWDGSNHVGTFTDDASDAIDAVEAEIEQFFQDGDNCVTLWDASDWLFTGRNDEQDARNLGVKADMTDGQLETLAEQFGREAEADDAFLDGDIASMLRDLRDRLRDAA
jgi:hypothetical protein